MLLVRTRDQLRPLDSEHNAVWQCLHGESAPVRRVLLTASGGPFRTWTASELETVTPDMALRHPVWSMGAKITVDSATLMNKGIELIEAMTLFGLEPHQVDAVVSPGSFVHALAEFEDGSVKMLAGVPDMRLPASSCLFWPERRFPCGGLERPVVAPRTIAFEEPDPERFPALRLAREAMERRGPFPAVLVGADEVAVERFLSGRLGFPAIAQAVEETMEACSLLDPENLEDALAAMEWAGRHCAAVCGAWEG